MAHIRQILANLSISVSEFKKNPKTVIKAVKSEPIAVIINDKPAFYCVPADILESLYSKFYEMNEIQNIQELNNDSDDPVCGSDDDSFGVHDIFQSIEDEQAAKIHASDDLVDPIKNSVADPLDEEVANQLNCSIDKHLMDSNNKVVAPRTPSDIDLSFSDVSGFDDFGESLMSELTGLDKTHDLNYVSSLSDLDNDSSHEIKSNQEATLAHADKVIKQEQMRANAAQNKDKEPSKLNEVKTSTDSILNITSGSGINEDKSTCNSKSASESNALELQKEATADKSTPCEKDNALSELSEVSPNSNNSVRSLVSGPHSFSLEHVAKTYSPYKQKKLLEKRQNELKKEQKLKQKEFKKLEKASKELKSNKKGSSKKSKFVRVKPENLEL